MLPLHTNNCYICPNTDTGYCEYGADYVCSVPCNEIVMSMLFNGSHARYGGQRY